VYLITAITIKEVFLSAVGNFACDYISFFFILFGSNQKFMRARCSSI